MEPRQKLHTEFIDIMSDIAPEAIIRLIDLTLLDDAATEDQLRALCEKALLHRVAAMCVLPQHVAACAGFLGAGSPVALATTPGEIAGSTY